MRELVDRPRLEQFMRGLGHAPRQHVRVYLTGGATAVLLGWRSSTIDIDLRFAPEDDAVYRAIPELKESLHVNVELAAPSDFIPALPGWEERSSFIVTYDRVSYYHYDLYSQALSKIQRGHDHDLTDVACMIASGRVEPRELMRLFEQIAPELIRYPAIDPKAFRQAVEVFKNAGPRGT